jgi:hypothetical protein
MASNVFFNHAGAYAHAAGNCGVGQSVKAVQRESLPAARRQPIDGGQHDFKLLLSGKHTLGIDGIRCRAIDIACRIEELAFTFLTPEAIDKYIAGDANEIAYGLADKLRRRQPKHMQHGILRHIIGIGGASTARPPAIARQFATGVPQVS